MRHVKEEVVLMTQVPGAVGFYMRAELKEGPKFLAETNKQIKMEWDVSKQVIPDAYKYTKDEVKEFGKLATHTGRVLEQDKKSFKEVLTSVSDYFKDEVETGKRLPKSLCRQVSASY